MSEGWIDLHTHVLFGLDDGAPDPGESLRMVRAFLADGVTTVAATPHLLHPRFAVSLQHAARTLEELKSLLEKEGIENFSVVPGAEVRYRPDLPGHPDLVGFSLGGTGKYLLLELPYEFLPEELPRVLFELCAGGITPILAHAERYPEYQDDPGLLEDAVRRGALVQVTASSVTGRGGRAEKKLSHRLLRKGLVHVLASDAHDATRRPPGLTEAAAVACKLLGDRRGLALVRTNPARILRGEPIPRDD